MVDDKAEKGEGKKKEWKKRAHNNMLFRSWFITNYKLRTNFLWKKCGSFVGGSEIEAVYVKFC